MPSYRRLMAPLIVLFSSLYGCHEEPQSGEDFVITIESDLGENSTFDDSVASYDSSLIEFDMYRIPYDQYPPSIDAFDMDIENDLEVESDMGTPQRGVSFVENYWSATHNSYEGGQRGTVLDQLSQGVRAIEYDVHDNDFESEGYRLGHFQYGDAVDYGEGNPGSDRLEEWLDVVNEWSDSHRHAPILLVIDLKDNLTDNRSYRAGNLAHLNEIIRGHLDRLWSPHMGLDDVSSARDFTLCILSGDASTRRAYLHDQGRSPSLSIKTDGQALEVHDSGNGYLWYWSGVVSMNNMIWKRHGRYDSGRRPVTLLNASGDVIEVHQSEARDRLWASTGSLSSEGELTLESARDFSNGARPTLRWRDPLAGLFSLRYERDGRIYERDGTATFPRGNLSWGAERAVSGAESLFDRDKQLYQGKQYTVSDRGSNHGYPSRTLWLSVSEPESNISVSESPIRYQQLCFVEWQRQEYLDDLLGAQVFGALPGDDYYLLPDNIREDKLIRGWQYSGRDSLSPVPQVPSTDTPYSASYQQFIYDLDVVE